MGADIDKHRHIAFGKTLYYPHVLLDALHHPLEGTDHGTDLIVLIAVEHAGVKLNLIRAVGKPLRPLRHSRNGAGDLFGGTASVKGRNKKSHKGAEDIQYDHNKYQVVKLLGSLVSNVLVLGGDLIQAVDNFLGQRLDLCGIPLVSRLPVILGKA